MSQGEPLQGFRAFLSHRYKSPEVNLYFFDVFTRAANVQFEVDQGLPSMNVTRIERMIRDADAFIGIYPYPDDPRFSPPPDRLRQASRYFRLEIDLAIRSGRPALVFYDQRYRGMLRSPDHIRLVEFDYREVTSGGASPRPEQYLGEFDSFLKRVGADLKARAALPPRGDVGLLLDPEYGPEEVRLICDLLRQRNYRPVQLPWPLSFDLEFFRTVAGLEWAVADIGSTAPAVAYLHGRFVPTMRLRRGPEPVALEQTLYSGVEVGYSEDLLPWQTPQELGTGLEQRLTSLDWDRQLIGTPEQAVRYFRKAALRQEGVFLSYAGADRQIAATLSAALRKRFHSVFDYRDMDSIPAGEDWIRTIFEGLGASAVSIPLLSGAYFESGNCLHELEQIVARRDSGRMLVLPFKLHAEERLELPAFAQAVQYREWSQFDTPETAVEYVIERLEHAARTAPRR